MLGAKNVLLIKSRANKSPIDFEREQFYLLASYRLQSYREAKANREVHFLWQNHGQTGKTHGILQIDIKLKMEFQRIDIWYLRNLFQMIPKFFHNSSAQDVSIQPSERVTEKILSVKIKNSFESGICYQWWSCPGRIVVLYLFCFSIQEWICPVSDSQK